MEGDREGVVDGVTVSEEGLAVRDELGLRETEELDVGVTVTEPDTVMVGVVVAMAIWVVVELGDGVAVEEPAVVMVGVRETLAVCVVVKLGVRVWVTEADIGIVGVLVGVVDVTREAQAVGLGATDGCGDGVAERTPSVDIVMFQRTPTAPGTVPVPYESTIMTYFPGAGRAMYR